jgi:F-type H+-transporting ATPase subunit gamma
MNKILVALKESAEEGAHPFFSEGVGSKSLVLVITTDKGLCGALNTNLLKKFIQTKLEEPVDFVTIGRKGAQALARLRKTLIADFPIKDPAKFLEVRSVGNFLQEKFLRRIQACVCGLQQLREHSDHRSSNGAVAASQSCDLGWQEGLR